MSETGRGRDIEECRQEAGRGFADGKKPSRHSDVYVKYANNYLSTHRVYSESTLTLGTMWLFDDFEKEQSAGIGALLELSFSTNLKNLLQVIPFREKT